MGGFWADVGQVGVGGLVKSIGHPFGRVPNEIGDVCGRVFGHVGLASWVVNWACWVCFNDVKKSLACS